MDLLLITLLQLSSWRYRLGAFNTRNKYIFILIFHIKKLEIHLSKFHSLVDAYDTDLSITF